MKKLRVGKAKIVHEDSRGYIADILNDKLIRHIGIITCRKGSVRGQHYHKSQKQYTFVVSGKIKVVIRNLKNKKQKNEQFVLGAMDIIAIPAMHYHLIEALEDSTILTLSTKSRSGNKFEDDTFRLKLK